MVKHNRAPDDVSSEIDLLRDDTYFLSHERELMRDFEGKYVAIRGEQVLCVADTMREIHAMIYERYNDDVYALVRMVCTESFAPPGDPVALVF